MRLLILSMLLASTAMAHTEEKAPLVKMESVAPDPVSEGIDFAESVFSATRIQSVYSATTEGERGPGPAVHVAPWVIRIKDRTNIGIGPAYVAMFNEDNQVRNVIQFGATFKVANAEKFHNFVDGLPAVGHLRRLLNVDLTEAVAYCGAGTLVDHAVFTGSLGLGGIRFGN